MRPLRVTATPVSGRDPHVGHTGADPITSSCLPFVRSQRRTPPSPAGRASTRRRKQAASRLHATSVPSADRPALRSGRARGSANDRGLPGLEVENTQRLLSAAVVERRRDMRPLGETAAAVSMRVRGEARERACRSARQGDRSSAAMLPPRTGTGPPDRRRSVPEVALGSSESSAAVAGPGSGQRRSLPVRPRGRQPRPSGLNASAGSERVALDDGRRACAAARTSGVLVSAVEATSQSPAGGVVKFAAYQDPAAPQLERPRGEPGAPPPDQHPRCPAIGGRRASGAEPSGGSRSGGRRRLGTISTCAGAPRRASTRGSSPAHVRAPQCPARPGDPP